MVEAEACESKEAGEGFSSQVVERVVAKTQPFNVLQALEGHVGDVDQLVVCEGEHVEEAQLSEGPKSDLLNTVVFQLQLLQGGEAVKGLLVMEGGRNDREVRD